MTRQDSLALFAILAAAYPREPLTEAQIALYEAYWADYPFAAVRAAVLRHIAQSPWFPRVSDLLALICADDGIDVDRAWAVVRQQIRAVGVYGHPEWPHPAIAAAVEALGWDTLCLSTNPEADRAHFLRFFEVAQRRYRAQQQWDELPVRLRQALSALGTGDASTTGAP
ncbi:hypothetical protein BXT84_00450 [Sulfobacillus thermotolerans]|uniref:Replicative helicase inhibitor G39P N-terminal domain-containing protein n=1 Tax=Sulfobacillus thermotolerans TaxID=338644 RepID=A0ABM6RMU8_9FIRM|nr:hypothetical protein BXT84_00450 [Sulfobacillus thermotolerans]